MYHYCRRDYTEKAVAILEKSNDIDIFYEDGIFFKFAISKSNVKVCKSLLEYFNNKQFPVKNQGYEEAKEGDSINFSVPNSETRRGRVRKGVAQTLDTACNQGVIIPLFHWGNGKANERMVYEKNGISPCMTSAMGMGGGYTPSIIQPP